MKTILLSLLSIFTLSFSAQVQDPVHWSAQYKKISATEAEIIVTATIDAKWHTYSQKPTNDGPIPTSFTITVPKGFSLVGTPVESEAHEEFVPAFGAKISVFTGKAEFRQKLKTNGKAGLMIPIKVEYMTCNDMMCLPPKIGEF